MIRYKRIVLKLSGESLMGRQSYGIDPQTLADYATDIKEIWQKGVQTGVVIGGGNIFRGMQGTAKGFDRVRGDYMGMLATAINSLALQDALEKEGIPVKVLGGIGIDPLVERMSRHSAIQYLNEGKVVIISGGTGNPFFTTDTASALRGVEISADILLKCTRVDGVYTADPEKHPDAVKYEKVSFSEAYEKNLKIMDLTAFTLCSENNLPILVFDMNKKGNLLKVLENESLGTIVGNF